MKGDNSDYDLHALIHLLHEEGDVLLDVLVLELPLLQQLELLHDLALNHRDAVLLLHLRLLRLLYQISERDVFNLYESFENCLPEHCKDNSGNFLFLCVAEDISQDWYHSVPEMK